MAWRALNNTVDYQNLVYKKQINYPVHYMDFVCFNKYIIRDIWNDNVIARWLKSEVPLFALSSVMRSLLKSVS